MPNVVVPYSPRSVFAGFHAMLKRWAVLVVHRRGGKTVAAINQLERGALTCTKRAPRFAYVAPFRQQAKTIAWDYLKYYSSVIPGIKISEGELYVEYPNGGRVTLYGADNYEALRGIYLDGVVVDEPADMDEEVWTSILRPALADRQGWCVWIGTPKGRNAFYRLYSRALGDPEFFTMRLAASDSKILPESELKSARNAMSEAAYNREFECSFDAAIEGAIYGELIDKLRAQNRIADFPPEQSVPAHTFWDIGMSDYGCIWLIQFHGRDILLLDYISASGQPAAWYCAKILEWERIHGVKVRYNYMPHDANNRDKGSGKTYVQNCMDAGLNGVRVVPRTPDVWLGINEARMLIPRFYIHAKNCGKEDLTEKGVPSGIDCLEYYHRKEETVNGTLAEMPVHDEFSHGCWLAGTLIGTDRGQVAIENVMAGDRVITPCGFAVVQAAGPTKRADKIMVITLSNGWVLRCTPEHKIFTNKGLVCADALSIMDGLWTEQLRHLRKYGLTELPTNFRESITSPHRQFESFTATFIGLSGLIIMGQFLRGTISTTRTVTRWITELRTWSAYPYSITSPCTPNQTLGLVPMPTESNWLNRLCLRLQSGLERITKRKQSSAKKLLWLCGMSADGPWLDAKSADANTARLFQLGQSSAITVAKLSLEDVSADSPLVYDLSVRGHHCYLANGILVSNCDAIRTMAEAHRLGMIEGTSLTARENRDKPTKVIRGYSKDSFSIQPSRTAIR